MLRVILTITLLLFTACDRHTTHTQQKSDTEKPQTSYVDFKRFAQDRPCAQVRFMCLPERHRGIEGIGGIGVRHRGQVTMTI